MPRPPVIIEAAINGATPRTTNPNVPRTPAEITSTALACLDAGAAIVHNHNDEPNVGTLPRRAKIQLYFGGPMLQFGLPATPSSVDTYLGMLGDADLPWMVGVMGGDVVGTGLAAHAITRGGHVRVGLEDYAGDRTPTNEALVTEATALVRSLGGVVASSDQAAELLGREPS